jgi:hypothetical protein
MATIQDVLLGDFDMTKASKPVQYATADALAEHLASHVLDADEAWSVARFMREVGEIPRIRLWASLQAKPENLFGVHPLIGDLMVNDMRNRRTTDTDLHAWMYAEKGSERDVVLKRLGYIL